MKNKIIFAFLLTLSNYALADTLNKIVAIVYSPRPVENPDEVVNVTGHPIFMSDLTSGFEGSRTRDEVILDKLIELDARMLKIPISDEDVDRHLIQVQNMYNLTKEATEKLFKQQMGLRSIEEGKEKLKVRLMIDSALSYRVKKKVAITKSELLDYYQKNPSNQEAVYTIKQAFVSYNGVSPTLAKIRIEDAISKNKLESMEGWSSPVELKESQIAQDKNFIKALAPGKAVIANTNDKGIAVIQLVSKTEPRLLTFDEREKEIYNTLAKERWEKAFSDYKEKLFSTSTVKYID